MKIKQQISFLILLFIIPTTLLFASNYSFLDNSALTFFTDTDKNLMMKNIMTALNRYSDGKKASWKNPQTGAWGFAIPSHTATKKGLTCRNLKIFNSASRVTGESNYRLCKFKKEWKFV